MIDRDEHKDNYTVISNDVIRDERLSGDAFKMLAFMLSCDDAFEFSEKGLESILGWGRKRVRNAVDVLRQSGYLTIERLKGSHGYFGSYDWQISEVPKRDIPSESTKRDIPSEVPQNRSSVKVQQRNNKYKEITNISISNSYMSEVPQKGHSAKGHSEKEKRFQKPTIEEVKAYCEERQNGIDPQRFIDYYESNGWRVGKTSMKDWQATIRNWERNDRKRKSEPQPIKQKQDWFADYANKYKEGDAQ